MNKQELIENIAVSADITKAAAGRALDSVIDSITGSLKGGDSVVLVGFGTFSVRKRAARTGRNPQTGRRGQKTRRSLCRRQADPAGVAAGSARALGSDVLRAQLRLPTWMLGPSGDRPGTAICCRRLSLGRGH